MPEFLCVCVFVTGVLESPEFMHLGIICLSQCEVRNLGQLGWAIDSYTGPIVIVTI